jgi:hypothetical protein
MHPPGRRIVLVALGVCYVRRTFQRADRGFADGKAK